ncbi:MAG: pyridoxamine 5'-phosphate oxidase [Planctomycetota bacterium]|jgi:pyridoxamine 5'-phosphate oxidase
MDFDNPPADPIAVIKQWLEEAGQTDLRNPTAMALATVDADGRPSVRTVLLKGLDERGAVFYTNRNSRKGRALDANARAALVFYWDALQRQVTIEGPVSTVSDEESDAYFASRPRGAQIGAWASDQSEPVEGRAALEARVWDALKGYHDRDVPRPPHWGGYRVEPVRVELWQTRLDRLHDRVDYVRDESGGWTVRRLCP